MANCPRTPTRRQLLATTLATALLPAIARAATPAQLRIGLSAPNTTMDPHLLSNAPNNAVASHIFDALVTNDEQSHSTPGLAESWKVTDDTHWVFTLRPAAFSDGTPFTAADAIASLERATTIQSAASFRTYTRSIKAMQAPDPHTLAIETHAPDPLLPNSLSRIRVISARFKDASTADFNAGRAAVGTGAFVLKEYTPGSHVLLTRNDAWWGPRVAWSEVQLRVATDPGGRLAALLAGDLDFIENVPAEGSQRITADQRLHMIRGTSSRVVYIAMDQRRDVTPFITDRDGKPLDRNPLKDLRVRQALSLSINRTGIVERVMSGNAVPAGQFLPKGGLGTASDVDVPPYDPARAQALLKEAGYPNGFRLTLHGPEDRYINDAKIVQAVAQMFTRIGVETRVDVMPWSVYAGRNADFSVFLTAWGVNTGETSNPLSAICATPDKAAGLGIANEAGYSNPAMDAKLKQALRTLDDTARNALLAEASSLAFHDAAILPLHFEVSVWGARRELAYATRADQYTLAMGVTQA